MDKVPSNDYLLLSKLSPSCPYCTEFTDNTLPLLIPQLPSNVHYFEAPADFCAHVQRVPYLVCIKQSDYILTTKKHSNVPMYTSDSIRGQLNVDNVLEWIRGIRMGAIAREDAYYDDNVCSGCSLVPYTF